MAAIKRKEMLEKKENRLAGFHWHFILTVTSRKVTQMDACFGRNSGVSWALQLLEGFEK